MVLKAICPYWSDMSHRGSQGSARAIVAVVVLVVGVAAVLGMATGLIPSLLSRAGSGTSQNQATTQGSIPTTRSADSFSEYSWAELSDISRQIEAAGGGDASVDVARRYGLVNQDGTLTAERHALELSDGTTVEVRLAGIMHDQRSDASGAAGLTLVTCDAIAQRPMEDTATVDGGWEGSSMRTWLSADGAALLPQDLSSRIVPVNKLTNNVGKASDASVVTGTSDAIWLLSAHEVCGDVDWFGSEYGSGYSFYDDVLDAEGTQYECFQEAGVSAKSASSSVLSASYGGKATAWSYRTPVPVDWNIDALGHYFFGALDTGYPHGQNDVNVATGVVIGFCL